MSKLVTRNHNPEFEKKVNVAIATKAAPDAGLLLLARELVRQKGDIQEAFYGDEVDREYLARALGRYLTTEHGSRLKEVAEYLSDEREQLGSDMLMISPVTGKAMARLSPSDFYTPAPVPREDGALVNRDPTIKPEVQSAILLHYHDKDRDEKLEAAMLSRVPNSLPVGVAEKKTLFVTRRGRKQVASMIHDRLPFLIEGAHNYIREMFDFFPQVEQPPEGGVDFEWTATLSQGVQDPTTHSLQFDVIHHASTVVAGKWARELGAFLLALANQRGMFEETVDLTREGGIYVCSANTAYHWNTPRFIASAQGGTALYLKKPGPIGSLYIKDYQTEHREIHDKWTIHATMTGTIFVDWSKVSAYNVGVEEYEFPVEIVN
jgi:hypothetical protein